MERKFHGSENSLYGLFAPENESAEERKGLESDRFAKMSQSDVCKPICLHSGSSLQQWQHICLHHSFLLKYNNNKNKYTRTCK